VDLVVIGRDAELARVGAWLAERATAAGPPLLLVSGEAGVGKTALLDAVETGPATVVRAAANPWRATPFGLMAQVAPHTGAAEVRAHLLGVTGGRPLVLVLDDMHWSDEATLDLLPSLMAALAADPVAVLGAYRSDDLPRGHRLRAIAAELRHLRQVTELKLGPLGREAVSELIKTIIGRVPNPVLVDKVVARTEGVPFFVEELVAAGDAVPVPQTVRDAILLRTAGLGAPSRAALDIAAVIGLDFHASTVAAIGGHEWPDDLDDGGLVTVTGNDERRFRHALIQEALYSEVPWSRRRELHLAVADRTSDPAVAATHLLAGRDFDRARPALLAAAARQEAEHAYRDAAKLIKQALENWPASAGEGERLEAVDRLARCAQLCGDGRLAVTSLRELAAGTRRADVQRRLAIQHELLGNWPPALAAREAAAAAYVEAGQRGEAAVERLAIAAHLRSAASFRAALEMLDAAEADAAERPDLLCRIGGLRGNVLSRMGRAAEGVPLVHEALASALRHGLSAPAAEVYQRLADSLEHSGDYRAAGRAYDSAYEFCRVHEQGAAGQLCQACATVVMFHSGRFDRAASVCTEVLGDPVATAHARAVASGVLGLVHAMRGQSALARAALLESRTIARRIDLVAMEILSAWGLALLDEANGRFDRAVECYGHVLARCRETEERHYCVPVLQFAAARFASAGARAELGATTALLADAAVRSGQPEARAALSYALGESALVAGEPDAPQHLRRALELLDGLDLPIADVLVRQRLGATLSPSDEGRALLREALGTAHRLKARALSDRIGAALGGAAAGTGLTEREAQIMRLVGEGMTSRAIAAQLFLSVRTVEMHVRNAVAKLGCRTRAEAVLRLASR
jgi:DNA-binding CsgD family transcriptional regulator